MRPLVRRTAALVAAAVISAGLLAGCSESGDGGGNGGGGQGSFTPGVQQLDLANPVVKETFTVPGSDKDKVTVGVLGLETDGELQVLHLAFTPDFTSEAADAAISLSKMLDFHSFKPTLVDRNSQKIYNVVDGFSTDTSSVKTVNRKPMYVYAVFAAPQDDDKVFEVRLNDAWQPFVNIESLEKDSKK